MISCFVFRRSTGWVVVWWGGMVQKTMYFTYSVNRLKLNHIKTAAQFYEFSWDEQNGIERKTHKIPIFQKSFVHPHKHEPSWNVKGYTFIGKGRRTIYIFNLLQTGKMSDELWSESKLCSKKKKWSKRFPMNNWKLL